MSNLDDIYGRRQVSRQPRCCICKKRMYNFELHEEPSGERYCGPCWGEIRQLQQESERARAGRRCAICGGSMSVGMHGRCNAPGQEEA